MTVTIEEALRQPGVLAAWDLEVSGGTRELTVFDVSGAGAKQLAARRVPMDDVPGLDAALAASGHIAGAYDGHRPFVWRVTPGAVEVWSHGARELDARDGLLVDSLGRRAPVDSIAAIVGYVEDDYVDRGLKVLDHAGTRRTLCFELSPHASSDPTYSRNDLLSDSTWIPALGSALARWAGVPYRDEITWNPVRGLDAFALKMSDRPEAIPALLALLNDPSIHARVHASEGLVQKLGLDPLAAPRGSPLRRMMLAICSSLPTLWPIGAAELHHVLSAVHRGESPQALGLRYEPSGDGAALLRFWTEATEWKPFTLSSLAGMDAHDRSFAETVLVARLVSGDVNVLSPLRALGVPGWAAHVRAALPLVAHDPVVANAYADALSASSLG